MHAQTIRTTLGGWAFGKLSFGPARRHCRPNPGVRCTKDTLCITMATTLGRAWFEALPNFTESLLRGLDCCHRRGGPDACPSTQHLQEVCFLAIPSKLPRVCRTPTVLPGQRLFSAFSHVLLAMQYPCLPPSEHQTPSNRPQARQNGAHRVHTSQSRAQGPFDDRRSEAGTGCGRDVSGARLHRAPLRNLQEHSSPSGGSSAHFP